MALPTGEDGPVVAISNRGHGTTKLLGHSPTKEKLGGVYGAEYTRGKSVSEDFFRMGHRHRTAGGNFHGPTQCPDAHCRQPAKHIRSGFKFAWKTGLAGKFASGARPCLAKGEEQRSATRWPRALPDHLSQQRNTRTHPA